MLTDGTTNIIKTMKDKGCKRLVVITVSNKFYEGKMLNHSLISTISLSLISSPSELEIQKIKHLSCSKSLWQQP